MESVRTLIDRAAELCRTKRELAHKLGTTEQTLQAVLHSRRHLTPGQTIGLAHMLGLDPRDVLAQSTIERENDPMERGRLSDGFFPRRIGWNRPPARVARSGLAG